MKLPLKWLREFVNIDASVEEMPFLDFSSGYVQRAADRFPRQGSKRPWKLDQNYVLDILNLRFGDVADGTIDLVEAIKPLISKDPQVDVSVRLTQGSVRFRSPGLPRPIVAERADFTLHVAAAPAPLTWELQLASRKNAAAAARTAGVVASGHRRLGRVAGRGDFRPHLHCR